MKKMMRIISCMIFLSSILPAQNAPKVSLPEKYRKWLEEEVVYIITEKEKNVFLQLQTDKERDLFVEAFWAMRDPTPGTPQNEYKNEHDTRIEYANKFLGRETSRPGWMTDRGKVYIILGTPRSVDRYETYGVYPTEVWFYQGDLGYPRLPSAFTIVFYKRNGTGEYRLYSPVDDGPYSLIYGYRGDRTDLKGAYDYLKNAAPLLAKNSLSLLPSEFVDPYHPSLTSQILLAEVSSSPQKKINDIYADKFLKYKELIEVDYSANYISSHSEVKVIKDNSGIFFVNYSIEPDQLSLDFYEDKYYTSFELYGKISDLNGNIIYQFGKNTPVEFSEQQVSGVKSFSLQDFFPLIEGHYQFDLLLKNAVSKEFTSFETSVFIPSMTSNLQMSSLLLAYDFKENGTSGNYKKPFQVDNTQICFRANKTFSPGENLFLFFQIYGLNKTLEENGSIEFKILSKEEVKLVLKRRVNEFRNLPNFFQEISIKDLPPADYKVRVSLLDQDQKEILLEREDFSISPIGILPKPMVISRAAPTSKNEVYTFLLGMQYLNKKDFSNSRTYLESAFSQKPDSLEFALGLCRYYKISKDYKKIKEVLIPFLGKAEEIYEIYFLLGISSHELREIKEALDYYNKYLSHTGINTQILNLIGDCHLRLGNNREAEMAFQKSLEINSNQENIKKLLNFLQEKKK